VSTLALVSSFFFLSIVQWARIAICFYQFWPNLGNRTNGWCNKCHMTNSGSKVTKGSLCPKTWFCFKMHLLLQITWHGDMTDICSSAIASVYRVYTELGSKVIKGSFPVWDQIPSKCFFLLQTISHGDLIDIYASAIASVYRVYTELGSKVIKGSFPVWDQIPSKCIFCHKQHRMVTCLTYMHRLDPVSIGCTQNWGQRSLRGHFRF